jgi:hypothetical protein
MKVTTFLVLLSLALIFMIGCSSGRMLPVMPSDNGENESPADSTVNVVPSQASDVLFASGDGRQGYKAFGIFEVVIDPKTLTVEVAPTRKTSAIGTTFDADLTQFLTVSPCMNCLKIDGIRMVDVNQVEVGFAIKHPFADITKRPDLHGFDVRGIILANGNENFPLTNVALNESTEVAARANSDLLANPDGYTHHFVELANDPNYFDPPKLYDATINPYKNYFIDVSTPTFNPNNPSGYNVMKVGADWETQNYIFYVWSGMDPIDFLFVADCAYGQSATFQNRTYPYYFLPEFNRKEAWSVTVNQTGGHFQSGDTGSSVDFRVSVSDWQAGLVADPEFPNTSNLSGLSANSDVKNVSIEIPGISSLVEKNTPDSGVGNFSDPYLFNMTVTNTLGASAGWYDGLVAVRDDLQGERGPIGIPETPAGFPYPGPEIYDYSTYQIFKVRVNGSQPEIVSHTYGSNIFEGDFVAFAITTSEPDGDQVSYQWEQISPASPVGSFRDDSVEDVVWQAPPVYDIPPTGLEFEIKFTVSDIDGESSEIYTIAVYELNSAPQCNGIETDPFHGVIGMFDYIDFSITASDPDGDSIGYEWDMDWGGNPSVFDIDETGASIDNYVFPDQGFYEVGCRISENARTNPLSSICSRKIVKEGYTNNSVKVDDSDDAHPGYYDPDACMVEDVFGNPVYHVAWTDIDDNDILYSNTAENSRQFGNHQVISSGPPTGTVFCAKVAGNGPVIHVAWVECDTSSMPNYYRIKINSSIDGGRTFGAFGGERILLATAAPNYFDTLDICAGPTPNLYFMVFSDWVNASLYYRCYPFISTDMGETWASPSGNPQFRDVLENNYAGKFHLKVSETGTVHVLWNDLRSASNAYYYDWSENNALAWNTDIKITSTTSPVDASMDVDETDNAYFIWTSDDHWTYFRRSYFGDPPTLAGANGFFDIGAGNQFLGCDIWASPSGNTLITPIMHQISGEYHTTYFYSFDSGLNFTDYFIRDFGTNQVDDIICDGRWETDPNRLEICSAWVDARTSLIPHNDHIWSEFVYVAERF